MAFEIDDRVVVNENADWEPFVGMHGLVRSVFDEEMGYPPGKPIEVYLDGRPGGNVYFAEDQLDPEVN